MSARDPVAIAQHWNACGLPELQGRSLSKDERVFSNKLPRYEVTVVTESGRRFQKQLHAKDSGEAVGKIADPFEAQGVRLRMISVKDITRSFD